MEILDGRAAPAGGEEANEAAEAGKEAASAIVELLIARGADLQAATTSEGLTPLHTCARDGRASVMAALLAGGADALARDAEGGTPLMAAAASGDVGKITALLDHIHAKAAEAAAQEGAGGGGEGEEDPAEAAGLKACKRAMAMSDTLGWQALHHAVDGGHTAAAKLLMKKGAGVTPTTRGTRPLSTLHPKAGRAIELAKGIKVAPGEPVMFESRPSTSQAART